MCVTNQMKLGKKSPRQNLYINNSKNRINVTFTTVILSLSSSLLSLFLFLLCNKKYETLSHRPLANIQIKDVLTSPRLVRWRIQRLCQCSLLTPTALDTCTFSYESISPHPKTFSTPLSPNSHLHAKNANSGITSEAT